MPQTEHICSGIAEIDEVVAVEDLIDVGKFLGKFLVALWKANIWKQIESKIGPSQFDVWNIASFLLGGVLFALEEGASFLKQMLTWRMVRITFFSCKCQSQNYILSSFKIPWENIYALVILALYSRPILIE